MRWRRCTAAPRPVRGFTLIEVLLATVLLAAGLTLAFATVRAVNAVSLRGESIAARSERVRAVEGFLRRRLSGAMPMVMEMDPQTLKPARFVGEARRMRFVADLPDYLGHGGPYLHELAVAGQGDAQWLQIGLTMVQAGKPVQEPSPRPPEPLAGPLREVRFRYRGIDPASGRMGDWQDAWETVERLPALVRIDLRGADGDAWPPLVVALPQSGGNAGVAQ